MKESKVYLSSKQLKNLKLAYVTMNQFGDVFEVFNSEFFKKNSNTLLSSILNMYDGVVLSREFVEIEVQSKEHLTYFDEEFLFIPKRYKKKLKEFKIEQENFDFFFHLKSIHCYLSS